jgi:hypothetical protein
MKKEKLKIETSTDYLINKIKRIGDINYNETFSLHKSLDKKLNFFSKINEKINNEHHIELKSSILSNMCFELSQYEEASLFLLYHGFYNPSMTFLRICLDLSLTHVYYYLITDANIYLDGKTILEKHNKEFLEWEQGKEKYPPLKKIYDLMKIKSNSKFNKEEISNLYMELSKYIHARKNINSDGLKMGNMTNYFYDESNIKKYMEYQTKVYDEISKLLILFCQEHLN